MINLTNQQFLYNLKRHFLFQIAHSVSSLSPSLPCTNLLRSSPIHSPPDPKTGQWLCTPLESRISQNHQLQRYRNTIDSPYWHTQRKMILPEWRECGFPKLEHVIKNGLTFFQRNMFTTLILQLGKGFVDMGSRVSRSCLLAILVWSTQHLMSYALLKTFHYQLMHIMLKNTELLKHSKITLQHVSVYAETIFRELQSVLG